MTTIIPPYLKKGDTIGLVCPAGYMPADKAQQCIQTLQDWGYNVKIGPTLGHAFHYFSGTDAERLSDLQQMLDDTSVHAILCGRGGYGTSRIIDQLDFSTFHRHPKWIIGFSDITVLHSHLFTNLQTTSLHAPMAGAFNNEGFHNPFVTSLHNALTGHKATYRCPHTPFNRTGTTTAPILGGNLSIIAHLIGTRSDIDTTGKILFLEDVGEYIYNIDRMFVQLQRSGKLSHLAGLVLGGFTDMKDTTRPFGQSVKELIHDKITSYNYPVAYDFPVSHEKENYALKVGAPYQLSVQSTATTLQEL